MCVEEEAAQPKSRKRAASKPACKAPMPKKRSKAPKQEKGRKNEGKAKDADQENTGTPQGKEKQEASNAAGKCGSDEEAATGAAVDDRVSDNGEGATPPESRRKSTDLEATEASSPGSCPEAKRNSNRVQQAAGSSRRKRKLDDVKRQNDQAKADASIQHILGFKDMADCRPKNAAKPNFAWSDFKQLCFRYIRGFV